MVSLSYDTNIQSCWIMLICSSLNYIMYGNYSPTCPSFPAPLTLSHPACVRACVIILRAPCGQISPSVIIIVIYVSISFYDGCSLLITFIGSKDPLVWRGYAYIAALFIMSCTRTIFDQNHLHVCFVTGMRLRTAIVGVIYRKVRPPFCLRAFVPFLHPVVNFRGI